MRIIEPSSIDYFQAYSVFDTPQERQMAFFNSTAKYRLYGGQKGGGKSRAMRAEAFRQCMSRPGVRGLVLRRTTIEINENMLTPIMGEIPRDTYDHTKKDNIMTFDNGSTIRFSYCQNVKDVTRYQGIQYDFICIEELTHRSEVEFKMLMTSLRTTQVGITPNFFGSTNPGGIGHGWVKRLWINRDFTVNENGDEYEFIQASIYDNKILLDNDPNYLASLKALPEKLRRAYLEGDWDVFEGQYFTEFRRDRHVIDAIVPHVGIIRRIICLDYGFTNETAAYWLAQEGSGRVTAYRELYKTQLTYKKVAVRLRAMTSKDEVIDYVVADPAVVNKKSETGGATFKATLMKHGFKVVSGKNSRVEGWNLVRQYLAGSTNKFSDFGLSITSNCKNLIRTIPELVHDDTNVEDVNTRSEDHGPDALRYGLLALGIKNNNLKTIDSINSKLTKKNQTTKESRTQRNKRRDSVRKGLLKSKF